MDQLGAILDVERQAPRQHLVEGDAKRVEIGAPVDAAVHPAGLLGGDVVQRAFELFRCAGRGGLARPRHRDAEIGELGGERPRIDQDVGRLDVLVHHVAGVDAAQRLGDLARDQEKQRQRQRAALEVVRQRDAAAVREDQCAMASHALDRVGDHDAGIVERAGQRVFALQAGARLRIGLLAASSTLTITLASSSSRTPR